MDTANTKACKSFVANLWRPNTCTNCYRSKSLHRRHTEQSSPTSSKWIFGSIGNMLSPFGTASGGGNNSGKKHLHDLREVSSSTSALEGQKTSQTDEWGRLSNDHFQGPAQLGMNVQETMPKPLTTGPMIGIVRPYAVVDIDNESTHDDQLDKLKESGKNTDAEKQRYNGDANFQSNNTTGSTISLTVVPPAVPPRKSGQTGVEHRTSRGRQGVDKREWLTGEKNFPREVPKPAKIVRKQNLLSEYQRSMSTMSIEMAGARHTQATDNFFKRRHGRGKSVEPSDKNKTNVTVTRSSSMRHEPSNNRSKFRPINILSRRKELRNQASSAKEEILSPVPRVTSPHPVRRNMATPHPPHPISQTQSHHKVEPLPRPKAVSGPEEAVAVVEQQRKTKRSPPAKPPRTLSTFICSDEQDDLFRKLAKHKDIQSADQSGVGEVTISGLKPTEQQSNSSIQQPPTHNTTPDNNNEARPYALPMKVSDTQGKSQGFLPLGHSGYYAEIFPKGSSVPDGSDCLVLSNESKYDYDTLEPEEMSPMYTSPVPSTLSVTSSASQFPFDVPVTSSQKISPDTLDSYYALPCDSPNDGQINLLGVDSENNTPPSDTIDSYYTLPCGSLNGGDNSTGVDTPLSDTIESYYSLPSASVKRQTDSRGVESHIYTPPASPPLQNSLTNTLNIHLLQIMTNTLKTLCEHELDRLTCRESLWSTGWEDTEVISETEVKCKGKTFSIVATDSLSFNIQQSINTCQSLSPHMNICLIRSLMDPHPSPPKLLPQSPYYILTDHNTHTVDSFLLSQKNTLSEDRYMETVLLTLTQLFSALSFLHSYGVCHRDVGIECLYGRETAEGYWIVSLGDFSYAIHRPGPVTATTFVYGYHELKWLGGMDCRLPPEVIDTTRNLQTVNYAHTDSFSAGCLIYDLCGGGNPFELDSSLVFTQYTDGDLPKFESRHKTSSHLYKLATLLLKREPSKRVALSTALLVCQALLWLPEEWILEPISEGRVRYQLEVEKASLVAQMARGGSLSMPLNLLLKADFLLNCNASELIRALSLYTRTH